MARPFKTFGKIDFLEWCDDRDNIVMYVPIGSSVYKFNTVGLVHEMGPWVSGHITKEYPTPSIFSVFTTFPHREVTLTLEDALTNSVLKKINGNPHGPNRIYPT